MVVPVLDDGSEVAQSLAEVLQTPLIPEIPDSYYLVFTEEGLVVKNPTLGDNFRVAPFLREEFDRVRRQKINPKKDLLCRSLGVDGKQVLRVFDGTLGFGKDAVHLMALGVEVIGCESNPVVFHLLKNSLEKWSWGVSKLRIHEGESSECLLNFRDACDVVYLDPMFEDIKKKSAPKKNLAFLRSLSLSDTDVPKLVEASFQAQIKRVVVKRPLNSENLYGKPNITYAGKMIRYDVYTR